MEVREYLTEHWLAVVLLILALVPGLRAARLRKLRGAWPAAWVLSSAGLALSALGGLLVPSSVALWLGAAGGIAILTLGLIVIVSGAWSPLLGYLTAALIVLGLGGAGAQSCGTALVDAARLVLSFEPTQPWWLLLLGFLPIVVLMSRRSLAGLGPVRKWLAIGLRCVLLLLLTLALAEVRLRHRNESIATIFVVDRSLSIPVDYDPELSPDIRADRRSERVEKFINETVRLRGSEHRNDRAGLILFGRRPRLELPPSNAPAFNFRFNDAASAIDGYYTDIGAAIKLALASFPEGTGKRIVLLSDGNENLGNALEQARIARLNGAQIDVVPLAAGYRNENEVLVQAVEAPPKTEQGSRLPIRVLVRSYNPGTVYGTLVLRQQSGAESSQVPPSPLRVKLRPGLNPFSFKQPLTNRQQSYTYEAIFTPEAVETEKGELVRGLEGDRVQNNSASTHVVALGQRRILVLEQKVGDHQLLVDRLRTMANSKYKVYAMPASRLPENKTDLGVFLSNYDCVILANVPAEAISEEQQEMLRSNCHDQGCGLIMIGGPEAFGAGGWQGTPVEKALPVDCDIKSYKVQGKGGLVLIMHASEMSDGNRWQKEIAKIAIKKLSPMDEVGILHFDWGQHKWHIGLQEIGTKRNRLLALVDGMVPGDMPDFDGPLRMAHEALMEPERELATRHVIIISDGDPQLANSNLLARMKRDKVTVTSVGVATHGPSFDQNLKSISDKTGGRFYKVASPRALPAIYIKETRVVSQSFLFEKRFQPRLLFKSGPTEKLSEGLAPLYGHVRTTAKPSPLVEIPIVGPPSPEQDYPILAYWHYGLGKAVAFTSDARSMPGKPAWDRDWAGSDMYSKFWEQVVEWALRATETGRLAMTTEYNDGKVRVTIDARDEQNRPITDLSLQGGVSLAAQGGVANAAPRPEEPRKLDLKFEQKNSGLYTAEFKAEEAGSYFVNARARRNVNSIENGKEVTKVEEDSVRSGVTVPYSPEFADMESNTALLERVRDITGGETIVEDLLARAADPKDKDSASIQQKLASQVFRSGLPQFRNLQPMWYWLVFLTGTLFFFDIAVRRIALEPAAVAAAAQRAWAGLRGQALAAAKTPEFMDRLQNRKAQVSGSLELLHAARRFSVTEGTVTPRESAEAAAQAGPPERKRAAPPPPVGPENPEEAADYASRLLKAKQRVWEEREKEKES
jgi:uncharacterized membrane protein